MSSLIVAIVVLVIVVVLIGVLGDLLDLLVNVITALVSLWAAGVMTAIVVNFVFAILNGTLNAGILAMVEAVFDHVLMSWIQVLVTVLSAICS